MIDIIKYPWHTAHDHELFKLNHRFHLLASTHRDWGSATRPFPGNVRFVDRPGDVDGDLMILHVDQWTLDEPDKLLLFKKLTRRFDGPKIVINHGCNMLDGAKSEHMRDLIGEYTVVCNSSTAQRLWDIPNSRYIHHGMSPEEWAVSSYGRGNIIAVQPPGRMHSEFRNNDAIEAFESLSGVQIEWVGRDKRFSSFSSYRSFLASSCIAFFPSFASPNPRARTECMFSGLALVTTASQGEEQYIVNEHNGYASNDMRELYDYLLHLKNNPAEVRRIGANARRTAEERFHISRFVSEWNTLIDEVVSPHARAQGPFAVPSPADGLPASAMLASPLAKAA